MSDSNEEDKIETVTFQEPGPWPAELVRLQAELKPAAAEAMGYAALARDCLRSGRAMLAADMLAAAAAALAPPGVRPKPRSPVSRAINYTTLALDAMNRGSRDAAVEMFDCAAAALRESVT